MKKIFPIFILLTNFVFGQENKLDKSTLDKYVSRDLSSVQSIKDLSKNITELSADKKEQLHLLLLWSNQYMYADSVRFFQGGNPLTTEEVFKKRIALCDEFSNMLTEFCTLTNIPCIRIEGYVKYLNFKVEDKFLECNHAWNAVYIDSTWMLCDLFWSTNILMTNNNNTSHFTKKLNLKYFLSTPKEFITTHLPADPVFQFDNFPIKINAFITNSDSVHFTNERLPFIAYNDSIKLLLKLSKRERTLRIAQHAYLYNKYNAIILIIEYYNYGVFIVNNSSSTKLELKKAKSYFNSALSLIDESKYQELIDLKESCKQGINHVDKRLIPR